MTWVGQITHPCILGLTGLGRICVGSRLFCHRVTCATLTCCARSTCTHAQRISAWYTASSLCMWRRGLTGCRRHPARQRRCLFIDVCWTLFAPLQTSPTFPKWTTWVMVPIETTNFWALVAVWFVQAQPQRLRRNRKFANKKKFRPSSRSIFMYFGPSEKLPHEIIPFW